MSNDSEKKLGFLSEMAKFVEAVDPLSGPNIMRRAKAMGNGDGTITFRCHIPYSKPANTKIADDK